MDTPTHSQPNGSGDHDMIEEVRADIVEINQGGAGLVQAESVSINQGGAQVVETKNLSITQGGVLSANAETANLEASGAAVLNAETVHLKSASSLFTVADTVESDSGSRIGILLAGTIEGDPNVRMDARTAALIGLSAAVTLFVLKRLFSRS